MTENILIIICYKKTATFVTRFEIFDFKSCLMLILFYFKGLAEIFLKKSEKVRSTKTRIFMEKIALQLTPANESSIKEKICASLSINCFNTDRFDECIQYSKQTLEITPSNKKVWIFLFFLDYTRHQLCIKTHLLNYLQK